MVAKKSFKIERKVVIVKIELLLGIELKDKENKNISY